MTVQSASLGSTTEGGSMENQTSNQQSLRNVRKQPQAKKLPDLRNEKTYQKLLRIADNEVRASRKLRMSKVLRLLGS